MKSSGFIKKCDMLNKVIYNLPPLLKENLAGKKTLKPPTDCDWEGPLTASVSAYDSKNASESFVSLLTSDLKCKLRNLIKDKNIYFAFVFHDGKRRSLADKYTFIFQQKHLCNPQVGSYKFLMLFGILNIVLLFIVIFFKCTATLT